ncbi:MAG: hypothetical protein Tsb0013_06280 [Phycisphaerales bacterium]
MSGISAWTIRGAEGLPIHGNTHIPEVDATANVLIVHGWTGCKDRNIVPALTHLLASTCTVHRCTLSHAGMEKDADQITRPEEFRRDSLAFCVEDVRRVIEHLTPPAAPPFVLIGHSRAGATVIRCAAEAVRHGWSRVPDALVSVAGTATYTRFDPAMREELESRGYVERPCTRAPGGVVRMGPSWYEHHLAEPERDLYAEDARDVACPVLIVHGEADDAVPVEHADRARVALERGRCPSVEVVRVPGADHNFNAGGYGFERDNIATPESRLAGEAIHRFITAL